MKLFTIQSSDVWERLQVEKVMLADPFLGDHIDRHWPKSHNRTVGESAFYAAYDWMRQQMAKRIEGYQGGWPWWAWHTWATLDGKPVHCPDLRRERFNCALGDIQIRIELEVPDEKVLTSCFDGWHCVLNQWFLCHTEEEDSMMEEEWNAILRQTNFAEISAMVKGGQEPLQILPNQQAKMDDFNRRRKESWEKVFDLDWMRSSPLWKGGTSIQACFEELRLDQVVKITKFKGARKLRS
jgi:hypothetical protein